MGMGVMNLSRSPTTGSVPAQSSPGSSVPASTSAPPNPPPLSAHRHQQSPFPDPPPATPSMVLDSGNLDNYEGFITGISLCAAFDPKKFLTLFVSIPYLGLGTGTAWGESRTLYQYRFQQSGIRGNIPKEQVLVHQKWFLIFDNGLSYSPL